LAYILLVERVQEYKEVKMPGGEDTKKEREKKIKFPRYEFHLR